VVFVAAGAIVADLYLTHVRLADSFGPLGIVAAYGIGVTVAMLIAMPVSGGHLNPAISIAAYVSKRLSGQDAAGYVVAQVAGAVVAGFVLRGLAPKSAFQFASGGVPGLGQGISVLKGAGIELVLTFFLTFTFWAVCIDRRGPQGAAHLVGPIGVGLVVVVGGLAGSAFTGGAMNPARWFGSAVAGTHFANWLTWVAGPLLGALLGSLAYEAFFLATPAEIAQAEDYDDDDDGDEEEAEEEAEAAAAVISPSPAPKPAPAKPAPAVKPIPAAKPPAPVAPPEVPPEGPAEGP
jgi:glycerol uptake facilitator-like aquaporin